MTRAENQLAALIEAIELMTGINYGQRIEELEVQNAALVKALEAILGDKDGMVQWLIINNAANGISGLSTSTLQACIAQQAIAQVLADVERSE